VKKADLLEKLEYFNMVHTVTLRVIGIFDEKQLVDFRPQPNMRTPRELVFHIYTQEKLLAQGAQQGHLTADATTASNPEDQQVAVGVRALLSVKQLQEYADSS
jgi:hypothetical protein